MQEKGPRQEEIGGAGAQPQNKQYGSTVSEDRAYGDRRNINSAIAAELGTIRPMVHLWIGK